MPQIQVGTASLPILITPRINKIIRSVSWIKANQSYLYVSDELTPMVFVLQYMKRGDEFPTELEWNTDESTDDTLFFSVPDTFYEESVKWSLMVYWKVTKENTPPDPPSIEKIFLENAISLEVKDINNI